MRRKINRRFVILAAFNMPFVRIIHESVTNIIDGGKKKSIQWGIEKRSVSFMKTLISADHTMALFAVLVVIAALAIYLEQHYRWASRLSGCVLALLGAMALSNLRVIPADAKAYDFVWDYIVPMAIPMLLFEADIRRIWKESGRLLMIFVISSLGSLGGTFLAFSLLGKRLAHASAAAAMLAGTYTGGSVNLAAMARTFDAGGELVSAAVVADNLTMALYFFLLIAVPVTAVFRKLYQHPLIDQCEKQTLKEKESPDRPEAKNFSMMDIAKTFAIAAVIVALSGQTAGFLGSHIPEEGFLLTLLHGLLGSQYLMITTFSVIAATLFPKQIGHIPGAQEIGTFMIHIFFAVIGVPASIYLIMTKAPVLWIICLIIVATNMITTFAFGKLFGFTLEEICVASNANIGGPTTAAAYAVARGWQALVVPALLVGTLGYVIGNYYGILVGTLM